MIFLQASSSNWLSSWPLLAMLAVMYFLFLRPQIKKQKEQTRFIDSLEKGKEVVTNSGIIGRINKIEGNIVFLQVDQKTFIRMTKGSISKEMSEALSPVLKAAKDASDQQEEKEKES